jgi:subtilisin family serine protease
MAMHLIAEALTQGRRKVPLKCDGQVTIPWGMPAARVSASGASGSSRRRARAVLTPMLAGLLALSVVGTAGAVPTDLPVVRPGTGSIQELPAQHVLVEVDDDTVDLPGARPVLEGWLAVPVPEGRAADEVARALRRTPGVADAYPERTYTTTSSNDPLLQYQWHLSQVEATDAWTITRGKGATVAVLDTGIETTDPAFAGAIASCVSTIAGLVLPECDDTDGHGTHVSGSVASRDATYKGIAHGAKLAAVRVLHVAGAGTSADIIAGNALGKRATGLKSRQENGFARV